MPNTKSATKAHRQSLRRRTRNVARTRVYRTALKDFRKVVTAEPKKAKEMLPKLQKALDKAVKTGVIKRNKASRLKSGAAKLLAKAA